MTRTLPLLSCLAAALFWLVRATAGQCPLQWQPGDPIPTLTGEARATTVWDPDGAGPAPAVLVVGGSFGVGSMLTTCLAAYDGATWSALGSPPLLSVTALTVRNGLLVAAGGPGPFSSTVATFDGTTWSVIAIINGPVNSLVGFQGDLFAGGSFSAVNGIPMRSIARWNGTTWSEPGGGVFLEVMSMAVFGSLYVGGSISQAGTGTLAVGNLAIWNGTAWSTSATFNGPVRSLAARNGSTAATSFLFAGGDFTTVGGVPAQHVARLSAATGTWSALPGLPGASCRTLHVRSTGLTTFELHAAVGGLIGDKVWRLNGTSWTSLGPIPDSDPQPRSLAFFQNQLVMALVAAPGSVYRQPDAVRMHDGTAWHVAGGPGFDERIGAVTALGNDLVVGGDFRRYGSIALEHIARGGPGAWQPLGTGLDGSVGALCVLPNGDLIAGGSFTAAGGVPANWLCPHCGGRRRLLTAIQDPAAIRQVLAAMGLSAAVPELAAARSPPGESGIGFSG